MGYCGEEDDDDIFTPLPPNNLKSRLNPSGEFTNTMAGINTNDDEVISPMNSNFSALICRDILRTIFERLPIQDLARASCVCRIWNSIASDREIQTSVFKSVWKLKDVIGNSTFATTKRINTRRRRHEA
ncbi:hypothetical protein AQUCO_01300254v1 [Aquilegia coerulea]|uniref:F-box domain-containing protein n=1 Tax=Aquilegia coerulea TaxID=218851 RepID=A0A2G5E0I3_AQUCA|nr:hypothetical protein AQUCO_01300254v1 [Aquilegia coerulea]